MALRRERDVGEWTILPADGRHDVPPEWPLASFCPREQVLWNRLWRSPQALMWEKFGQEIEVALYVRQLERFERPKSPIILGTLVRQMADSLGLTTPGLRANRWRIGVLEQPEDRPGKVLPMRPSARERLARRHGPEAG